MFNKKFRGLFVLIIVVMIAGYCIKVNNTAHFITETVSEEEMRAYNDISTYYTDGKLNINTADVYLLKMLEGIGEKTAQAIVDYRTQNGNFATVEDLKNISGISDKKLDKIRDDICIR